MRSDAIISNCGLYRYELIREWSDAPILGLIMLNPSTADHRKNDPTVLAARVMAERWGFGGLLIGNLFAWRSSSPAELRIRAVAMGLPFIVGPENDVYLRSIIRRADQVMVGWGSEGEKYRSRVAQVDHLIRHLNKVPKCIGTTAAGDPKHPLLRFHTTKQKAEAALGPWSWNQGWRI